MKKYLDHIKSKSTHDRRQHAMQLSAGIVAIMFVAWISTIGLRFTTPPQTASDDSNVTQLANTASANPYTQQDQNSLIVASTTSYTY